MAVSASSCGANVARISAVALVRSFSGFMSSWALGHWSIWGHLGAAVKRIFAGASPGLSASVTYNVQQNHHRRVGWQWFCCSLVFFEKPLNCGHHVLPFLLLV